MNSEGKDGLLRNIPYQIHVCVAVYVFQWLSLMLSMLFCIHLLLPMDRGEQIASPVFCTHILHVSDMSIVVQ